MKKETSPLLALGVLTALGCAGCASHTTMPGGTTLGEIQISGVRVSSRERLINDRLERSAFLAAEINRVQGLRDNDFGLQGVTSVRSLTGVAASLGLNLDTGGAKLLKLKKDRDAQRLQKQLDAEAADADITKVLRKKVLDGLNDGSITPEKAQSMLAAIKAADPSAVDKVTAPDPSTAAAAALRTEAKALSDSIAQVELPDAGKITASQIDLFRDKLALLEEIRAERIAVELDERHDLMGGTLLRLAVDSTVIPQNDTSAWGIVEMTVTPVLDTELFTPKGFVDRLNDLADSRVLRARRQYVSACYGKTLGVDQERTGVNMLRRFAVSERKLWGPSIRTFRQSKSAQGEFTSPGASPVTDDDLNKLEKDISALASEMRLAAHDGKGRERLCGSEFEDDLMSLVYKIFPAEIWGTSLFGKSAPLNLTKAVPMTKREVRGQSDKRPELRFQFEKPTGVPALSELEAWLKPAKSQLEAQIYAYAATPKEQVQRLAQNGSRRDAMELMLALQAISGAGSASAAISMMKVNEAIASTLHRQPLVVGYSRLPTSDDQPYRTFGWVIGPRFKITEDWRGRPEFGFRHRAVQNTLSAEVVVPSLAEALEVEICTSWRPEVGDAAGAGATAERVCRKERVPLPQSDEALAETFDPDSRRPQPELYARKLVPLASANGGLAVLLQGSNLWRNPQVFVGGIKASSVSVTSDMRGINAVFDAQLKDLDCNADRIVTVVTSTGSVDFGQLEPPGKDCPLPVPKNEQKEKKSDKQSPAVATSKAQPAAKAGKPVATKQASAN